LYIREATLRATLEAGQAIDEATAMTTGTLATHLANAGEITRDQVHRCRTHLATRAKKDLRRYAFLHTPGGKSLQPVTYWRLPQ